MVGSALEMAHLFLLHTTRLFPVSGACGIENIKMPPISCIYAGVRCSVEDKAGLIEIAKELNVPVKQMVVDRGEYTLHAQESE